MDPNRIDGGQVIVSGTNTFKFTMPKATCKDAGTEILVFIKSSNATTPYAVPAFNIDTNGSVLEPQAKIIFNMGTGSLKDADSNDVASVSIPAGTIGVDDIAAAIEAKKGKFAAQDSDNYKFGGWSETNGGTAVDSDTWSKTLAENEELTLYATWTEKSTISAGDITIDPTSVNFNNNNQKPTLKIGSSLTGVTADDITLKYNGSESASGKKDAATYAVTADIASTANYKPYTGYDLGNWTIKSVDYTIGTVTKTVNEGDTFTDNKTTIDNATAGIIKDLAGNNVAGTITITGVTSPAASDQSNLSWSFAPTTADSNYNAASGNNASIVVTQKTVVTPSFGGTKSTYDGAAIDNTDVNASIAQSGDKTFVYGTDFKLQYSDDGANFSDTAPVDADTYTVKIVLIGDAADSYKITSGDTASFTIEPKTVTLTAIKFSKTYDGTTVAATLEDDSAFDISKLTVNGETGVNVVADGALTATYNSKDVEDANKVTITGVKLSSANYKLDADALKMAGTIKPIELTATYKGDESTSTKAKTYGDTIASIDGANDFDITGTFAAGDSAATILNGVTYASTGTAATANVGEYNITADTTAMSKNYTLTVDGKIKVTPKTITLTVTPKTGLKYKVAAYDANAVVDVAADGLVNGDSASYAYTVKDGAEIKNANTYEVTVGLAEAMTNYTAEAVKTNVEIAKADYTKGADVKGSAAIGDKINGITIPGDVIGADGNKVTGTFTITADDSIVAEADKEYKNLSYTFATDAADKDNYNPYSGNDGYIKASSKTPVSVTIAVDPVIPVGQPVEVNVNAGELSNTDYKVEYKAEDSEAWTETVPTEPAKYEVRVVLTPEADKKYVLQGTASTTFEIVDKFTITYEQGHFAGAELTDTDLVKAVENGKTLNLDGKVFGNAGDFKQVGWYDKATGQLVSGDITVTASMTFVAAWEYKVNVVEMKQDGSAKEPVEVTFTDSFDSVPVANPAVSINADPAAEGFVFTKWTAAVQEGATGLAEGTIAAPEELSTSYTAAASGTYPISGTVVLTPNYKGAPVDLTAKKPSHGKYSVVVDGVTTEVQAEDKVIAVDGGATVEVIPTADAGYKVSTIKYGTKKLAADENGKYTFTMPTEPTKLTVSFSSTTGGSTGGGNSGLSTGGGSPATPKPSASASPEPSASVEPAPSGQPGVSTGKHDAYVYGYPDGSFKAENGITRAETAAIFARALTDYVEGTAYTGSYSDVADDWYTNYVNFLSTRGVITGYEDGTFRPDNNITRREFTAMITRLGEVLEANGTGFPDVADTDWAADNIYTAAVKGLVNGYEDGTFRPDNNITRAEAVKIVNAYLGRGTDAPGLANADYTTFPDVTTSHWAYFEIIEAANDHTFTEGTKPEVWTR